MLAFPEFQDPSWLLRALTHRSYINEHPEAGEDNERLEFVGDAVLKLLLSWFAHQHHPQMREGEMTLWRSELEKNQTLARVAARLNLGDELRLGRGTSAQGGRENAKILSGALEAVIGGYFLDSGFEAVQRYVEELLPDLEA